MDSDETVSGGDTSALARLTALLTSASDTPPTARELAELLWLARELEGGRLSARTAGGSTAERTPEPTEATEATEAAEVAPPAAPEASPTPPIPPTLPTDDRVPLHLPTPRQPMSTGTADTTPLLAPAPPMLPHPLALQRALRPLKRTVPAARARLLDERATADRIARLGAHPDSWLPVLRPARDRWLRLNLVHDTGPTMPVWRPLVRELHTVLAQSGVFRTVTLHPAGPDGGARYVPDPGDGRTVTLVVSDCMGPQWRPGPAGERWYRALRHWASRMPLAVVQPLPEHLWPTTALPVEPGVLSSPSAAAPLTALAFTPYASEAAPPAPSSFPLPVLEPGAPWLANWAALVASPGGARTPGAAAWLPPAPPPTAPAPSPTDLPAQDLVLRFRATASPEAFRLAGHLALAVPSVPVMRLVQRAVDRDPRPQHLAEVILSGMLTAAPGPPGSYDFRPGVRDLLLRTLPRSTRGRTRELLARIGGLIDERAGLTAGEFHAETSGSDGNSDGPAFATVSPETVLRLGGAGITREQPGEQRGPSGASGYETARAYATEDLRDRLSGQLIGGRYRLLRRRGPGRRMWQAVDTRTEAPVVVHLYPQEPAPQTQFRQEAELLCRIDSPHVARIRDFGVEYDIPYLVAEFMEGVTLSELVGGSGPGVSFEVFARLVCDGTAGLRELHDRGLVRGQAGPDGLLLRPDGTLVISRFALGRERLNRNAASDIALFNLLLQDVAPHVPAPQRFRPLLHQIEQGSVPSSAPTQLAEAREAEPLRIRMLGPLRISRSSEPLGLPTPYTQALLCMLVLSGGRRMNYEELAAGLWQQPPAEREYRHTLDLLAAELRRILGPGTLALITDGYALYLAGAYVDAFTCEEVLAHRPRTQSTGQRRALLQETLALFHGDPLEGVPGPAAEAARTRFHSLRRDLTAALEEASPPPLRFETDTDLSAHPESRITLEYAVHQVLARGALSPQHYEVQVRPNGYSVRVLYGIDLLPVLVAALRWLPDHWATLGEPPRLLVTFGIPARRSVRSEGRMLIVVSPDLYGSFIGSSAASGPYRFHPLYGDSGAPNAWYHPGGGQRELVKGPGVVADLGRLGIPAPGRTAVVHTGPEGPLTPLNPADPHGGGTPRPVTYYEVDLTPHHAVHQVSLPSSGKGDFTAAVELSWRVADPVAFVRAEVTGVAERLLEHFREAAPRITRHHSVRRPAGAQRAVNSQLGRWPVPGLNVTCTVTLAPDYAPPPEIPPSSTTARPLSELLGDAETVLFGFDGPLVRLFTATSARAAALELLRVVAEHRDPEDASRGRAAGEAGAARELFVHPLDVLRAFAHHRLGPLMRERLDQLELRTVPDAPTTHHSLALVRALHSAGRRVGVATDVCEQAVRRHLESLRLPLLAGVHGRADDLGRLMPHPDCLLRALRPQGTPARTGVLIGSTLAELTAAQQVGLRFIGLARNPTVEQRLREAGCEVTVPSLTPVLEAARSL
ncbi:SAV_2336 N-terminal domain-related protein [Streptomyces sp. T028]|uniref:SAV_2336 N-terminal domain-related protein n=1 Tax=Streptomyces sp. T028 TaxID=3394379 RepID=UPI003A8A1860